MYRCLIILPLFFGLLLSAGPLNAESTEELLTKVVNNTYHPKKFGLSDLVVELELDFLKQFYKKRVKDGAPLPKIEFFWKAPDKRKITVGKYPEALKFIEEKTRNLLDALQYVIVPLDPDSAGKDKPKLLQRGEDYNRLAVVPKPGSMPYNKLVFWCSANWQLITWEEQFDMYSLFVKYFNPHHVETFDLMNGFMIQRVEFGSAKWLVKGSHSYNKTGDYWLTDRLDGYQKIDKKVGNFSIQLVNYRLNEGVDDSVFAKPTMDEEIPSDFMEFFGESGGEPMDANPDGNEDQFPVPEENP